MRLIDADALKNDFYPELDYDHEGIAYTINTQPTIEPKRGAWIKGDRSGITYKCVSVCSVCDSRSDYMFNFCPNCGADMSGGDKEGK